MADRMLCRVTDDPSYDRSDYEEGRGYYAPYQPDWRTEPEDANDYEPVGREEMQSRILEVKQRLGITEDD